MAPTTSLDGGAAVGQRKTKSSAQPPPPSTLSSRVIAFWHDRCCSERTACLRSSKRDPTFRQHHKSGTCSVTSSSSLSSSSSSSSSSSPAHPSDLSHQRAILHFLYTTILVPALFTFLCQSLPHVGGNFGKHPPLMHWRRCVQIWHGCHCHCQLHHTGAMSTFFPMRSHLMTLTLSVLTHSLQQWMSFAHPLSLLSPFFSPFSHASPTFTYSA